MLPLEVQTRDRNLDHN